MANLNTLIQTTEFFEIDSNGDNPCLNEYLSRLSKSGITICKVTKDIVINGRQCNRYDICGSKMDFIKYHLNTIKSIPCGRINEFKRLITILFA